MNVVAVFLLTLAAQGDPEANARALAGRAEHGDVKSVYRSIEALLGDGPAGLAAVEDLRKQVGPRAAGYLDLAADELRWLREAPPAGRPVQRYSLKANERNLADVLEELSRKTGYPVSLLNLVQEERVPNVTVDVRDATALEAFDAVCKAGNLMLLVENGTPVVYAGDYEDYPRFFYGSYMVQLESCTFRRTVTFRRPSTEVCELDLFLLWDQLATPVNVRAAEVLEAVDDKGNDLLLPPAPKTEEEERVDGGIDDFSEGYYLDSLVIKPPDLASEKIARVRGRIPVVLPRTTTTLRFEKPAVGAKVSADGYEAEILQVSPEENSLVLALRSAKAKREELSRMPKIPAVTVAGGQKRKASVVDQVAEGDLKVEIVYREFEASFQERVGPGGVRPSAPVEKLELQVVTSTHERKIPFEFRDVKLK